MRPLNQEVAKTTRQIIRQLQRIQWSGYGRQDVFISWVNLLDEAVHDLLWYGIALVLKSPDLAENFEETMPLLLWGERQSRKDTSDRAWVHLTEAANMYLSSALHRQLYIDLIGEAMLGFEPGLCPFGLVSHEMAHRIVARMLPSGKEAILEHLRRELNAIYQAKRVREIIRVLDQQPEDWRELPATYHVFEELTPLVDNHQIRPYVVLDGMCSTGRLLLTCADHFPRWAIGRNFVIFYGAEQNPLLKKIAAINCRYNGLSAALLALEEDRETKILLPDLILNQAADILS